MGGTVMVRWIPATLCIGDPLPSHTFFCMEVLSLERGRWKARLFSHLDGKGCDEIFIGNID